MAVGVFPALRDSNAPRRGFSLIEVTLAIGIMAFSLVVLLGLLPVGLKANRTSVDEIIAMSILGALEADMRTSPVVGSTTSGLITVAFKVDRGATAIQGIGANKILLDSGGKPTTAASGEARYRLIVENIAPMPSTGAIPGVATPYRCRAKVAWPAGAQVREDGPGAETAAGSVEVYLALYLAVSK